MNWTQIFGDDRLLNALAQVGIPQLYLIDKDGRTIYNSKIVKDFSLELLKKTLSERLNK
jgi:hypothetical protein